MRHRLMILAAALLGPPAAAIAPQELASLADSAQRPRSHPSTNHTGIGAKALLGSLFAGGPQEEPATTPTASLADGSGDGGGELDLAGILALLEAGEIGVHRAFAGVQRLALTAPDTEGSEAVAAAEWCLAHFDAARVGGSVTGRGVVLPYTAAEASTKIRLYRAWTEAWSGDFADRSYDPLEDLDRESRFVEPALGRRTALGLLEELQDRAVAPRARANVLLARAGILARSSDPNDVATARSFYQRVERCFAGTAAATAARRAIWRSDNLSLGLVAPDFVTHDHVGNEIRLSDFRGQIVVVHFWQQAGSREWEDRYLDELRGLARRYWDAPFALIGVNGDEDLDQHRLRWMEHGVVWHEAFEPARADGARSRWKIDDWPSTYVLDENGVVFALGLSAPELAEALDPVVARRAHEIKAAAADGDNPEHH